MHTTIEVLCLYCGERWTPGIYEHTLRCFVCGESTNLKVLKNHKIDYYGDGKNDANTPDTDEDLS